MSNTRPQWCQFRDALQNADFSAASLFLEKEPSLLDERNGLGESVLHFLAVENNPPAVEWLHARGADLNAVNQFGDTPLMDCSILGNLPMVLLLLKLGANPYHQSSEDKNTPLHVAAESGHQEIYDLLISLGADPLLKNDYGETAPDLLKFNRKWIKP